MFLKIRAHQANILPCSLERLRRSHIPARRRPRRGGDPEGESDGPDNYGRRDIVEEGLGRLREPYCSSLTPDHERGRVLIFRKAVSLKAVVESCLSVLSFMHEKCQNSSIRFESAVWILGAGSIYLSVEGKSTTAVFDWGSWIWYETKHVLEVAFDRSEHIHFV